MNRIRRPLPQTGSALICILIAALLAAILFAIRFGKNDLDENTVRRPEIHQERDPAKNIESAREAKRQIDDRTREMNRRMAGSGD